MSSSQENLSYLSFISWQKETQPLFKKIKCFSLWNQVISQWKLKIKNGHKEPCSTGNNSKGDIWFIKQNEIGVAKFWFLKKWYEINRISVSLLIRQSYTEGFVSIKMAQCDVDWVVVLKTHSVDYYIELINMYFSLLNSLLHIHIC